MGDARPIMIFATEPAEEWEKAEVEFEKAANIQQRPEYFLELSAVKHRQGRNLEAVKDIDVAILLDPFGWELMNAKFSYLQQLDRMKEAIALPSQWKNKRG